MQQYVPKTVTPEEGQTYEDFPEVPPQMQAEVDAYNKTRNANFPNWYALQQRYYNLPPGDERKGFVKQFPVLKEYWDWNRAYKESHPNIEKYQQEYDAPRYDYSFMQDFTQPLYKSLYQYFLNNKPLSAGALDELTRIWNENGKQGDTLDGFINEVIRPLLSP
jgi:hypothetical protein